MKHAEDYYKEGRRDELLQKLSGQLAVNLKVDLSSLICKIDEEGRISWYGREGKNKLNIQRRMAYHTWEDGISSVHAGIANFVTDLRNVEFGVEFVHPGQDTIIKYWAAPKNLCVLSWFKMDGKLFMPGSRRYNWLADGIGIGRAPTLMVGKLEDEDLMDIDAYLSGQSPQKVNGTNFKEMIDDWFGTLDMTGDQYRWMKSDAHEGVVIYFEDGDTVKIVDRHFTEKVKVKKASYSGRESIHEELDDLIFAQLNYVCRREVPMKGNVFTYLSQVGYELNNIIIKYVGEKALMRRTYSLNLNFWEPYVAQQCNQIWHAEYVYQRLAVLLSKHRSRAHPQSGITTERKELLNTLYKDLQDAKILP